MLSLFKCANWFKEPQLSVVRDTQSLTSRTAEGEDYIYSSCADYLSLRKGMLDVEFI
jgi:hypothetical protein